MNQEWLLLDMHTHSQYSKINKSSDSSRVKEMKPEEFINELIAKKVKIFSVTDHNYFSKEYYDLLEEYICTHNIDMKIINGVEFDVYVTLKDGSESFIHICIYFDDNVNREELEKIVNKLYKNDDGRENKPHFNSVLDALYPLNCKMIIVPHGDKERGIFKNSLMNKIAINMDDDYYKYAMYKIFNAYDVRINFSDKSNDYWASNFCERTKKFNDLVDNKTKDEIKTIEKNISKKIEGETISLTAEENIIYQYILKYGSYFAYFSFSDWHNAEEYNPQINNFIFGNINYAFSSFEMATLDPVSRVITSHDFEIEIPDSILKEVNFKINDVKKSIKFSPGLNAIVGKRGSGKSLLLAVIKNLVSKDDDEGALKKYKKLKISDISGMNRGNINLSLGGLNSVAFLSQDQIKEIFEDPNTAQKTISNYFLKIKNIDKTNLEKIIKLGKKIKPYNKDFKNITSNILAIKKFDNYNYSNHIQLDYTDIKSEFQTIENSINNLIEYVGETKLNTKKLIIEKDNFITLKDYYINLITLYNNMIDNNNIRINDINSKRTNNQITLRQNMNDINNALDIIKENFEIQLNLLKFKNLLKKFEIDNPPVEIFKKDKYLFVTYYAIPDDIKDIIEAKVLKTINRGNDIQDIIKYIEGDEKKQLNSGYITIVDELEKYIKGDIFVAKKEFYQISNKTIDYKQEIKTMKDLKKHIEQNNIIDLTNSSPGMKSVAYLDMLFDLEEKILILDQPEDNIDNDYISNYLVPNIKDKKQVKQLIFVTHNPSVAVYGDAFNYIFVENNDEIKYVNYLIENKEDKENLINILEGGRSSFSNRNKKFGNILGDEEYENN